MADELTGMAKDMAAKNAPWADGVKWWVVLIQALILLGLGLFVLFVPDTANRTVVQLLGVFLLISGLLDVFQGLDNRVSPRAMPWHMFGAGAATAVGLLVVLDLWQDFLVPTASAVNISVGLILYGLAGLLVWIVGGQRGDRNLVALILPVAMLALGGVALFTRLEAGSDVVRWMGIASAIAGALLLVQTFVLYGKQTASPEPVKSQPAASDAGRTVDRATAKAESAADDAASAAKKAASDAADKIDSAGS